MVESMAKAIKGIVIYYEGKIELTIFSITICCPIITIYSCFPGNKREKRLKRREAIISQIEDRSTTHLFDPF
jgi:hypothetical protein